jgi:hypothetical protein
LNFSSSESGAGTLYFGDEWMTESLVEIEIARVFVAFNRSTGAGSKRLLPSRGVTSDEFWTTLVNVVIASKTRPQP